MIGWLLCHCVGHKPHQRRERRKLHGVMVWHTICRRCLQATPLVERTAHEHRAVVKVREQQTARLIRPANVTPIVRGKRA